MKAPMKALEKAPKTAGTKAPAKLVWPLLLGALLLSGCGQKGPLTLPPSDTAAEQAQ